MTDMPFSYEEILAMVASSSRHSDTVKSSMKRKKPKYRCLVCRSHTSMRRLLCRLCNLERALPSCKPQGCWVQHEMACKDCLEDHWRNVSDILMFKFTIDSIVSHIFTYLWNMTDCLRFGRQNIFPIFSPVQAYVCRHYPLGFSLTRNMSIRRYVGIVSDRGVCVVPGLLCFLMA